MKKELSMKTVDRQVWFQSREDLNFPRHFVFGGGRISAYFSLGRHSVYEKNYFLVSEDNGKTWLTDYAYPFNQHLHFISRLKDGFLFTWGEHGFNRERFKRFFTAAVSCDEGKSWAVKQMPVEGGFESLTQFNPLVETEDGTLLQGAYGNRFGEAGRYVYLLSRSPGETWWRLRAKVFEPGTGDKWHEKSTDLGANENAMVLLPGGKIMCVARTGYPESPLIQSWSEDCGRTWSAPVILEHSGVCPQLLQMNNGKLVLVFGARRKNKIDGALTALVSSDGGGSWSDPYVIYDGPGSCYSCVTPAGENTCLVSYAESVFRRPELPQYTEPGEFNKICSATLVMG